MQDEKKTRFFICGSALRGQPDHANLGGAEFVGPARTRPDYRLHDGNNGWHPAVYQVAPGEAGIAIPGEVYALTETQLKELLDSEPPALVLSEVELDTGEKVAAMLCPRETVEANGWADISDYGGWAAFKAGEKA